VDLCGGCSKVGYGRARLVVKSVIGYELARGTAPFADVSRDALKLSNGPVQIVIKFRITNQLARRTFSAIYLLDRRLQLHHRELGFRHGGIQVLIKRFVVYYSAEGALTLIRFVQNLVRRYGEFINLLQQVVAGLGELIDRDRLA